MVRNGVVSDDVDGERERVNKEEQVVKWKNMKYQTIC